MTLENSATGMLFIGLVCILGPYNTSDKTLFVYLHIFEKNREFPFFVIFLHFLRSSTFDLPLTFKNTLNFISIYDFVTIFLNLQTWMFTMFRLVAYIEIKALIW